MIAVGSAVRATVGALICGTLAAGCSASVQGRVNTGEGADKKQPDPFARLNEPEPNEPAEFAELERSIAGASPRVVLLGARHDVQLVPRAKPSCSCMAFAAGKPTDARFVWEDQTPVLVGTDSTVVAFGMVEGECAAEVTASYRGYESSGPDVHILLEAAVDGRPRLSGAVVPTPQPGGRFVVVPPKDAPFGKSRVAGETRCVLDEGAPPPVTAVPKAASAPSRALTSETPTGQLQRSRTRPPDADPDVPTSEEFEATPDEIPLDDGDHSLRDGFHLSMLLGLEYPIASVNVGNGLNPSSISALGGGFDVFIGGNQKPGMAVGFTIGGASAPSPSFSFESADVSDAENIADQSGWELTETSLILHGTQMNLFRVGAFVDYYFSEEKNWHGLLTLGYASLSFSGGAITDTPEGFAMQAGLGYDFWLSYHWSMGLVGRLLWSPMSAESLDEIVHVWSPNLGLSATFH